MIKKKKTFITSKYYTNISFYKQLLNLHYPLRTCFEFLIVYHLSYILYECTFLWPFKVAYQFPSASVCSLSLQHFCLLLRLLNCWWQLITLTYYIRGDTSPKHHHGAQLGCARTRSSYFKRWRVRRRSNFLRTTGWRLHSLVVDCVGVLNIGTTSVWLHGGTALPIGVLSGSCESCGCGCLATCSQETISMLACAFARLQALRDLVLVLFLRVTLLRTYQIVTLVGFALDRLKFVNGTHLLKFWRLVLDWSVVKVTSCSSSYYWGTKKLGLFLDEEELLRSQNTARSCYTDPANKLLCRNLIVFHRV